MTGQFASLKLRKREAIQYFQRVLVLRGNGGLRLRTRAAVEAEAAARWGRLWMNRAKLPGVVI